MYRIGYYRFSIDLLRTNLSEKLFIQNFEFSSRDSNHQLKIYKVQKDEVNNFDSSRASNMIRCISISSFQR